MKPLSTRTKQTGMTTLLIAAVMLIAATLIVFVSGRSGVQEQRISANERREAEAFAQAQARLDQALWFFKQPRTPKELVDYHNTTGGVGTRFCSAPPAANPCPTTVNGTVNCTAYDPTKLEADGSRAGPTVVACGWSDDGSARQFVMQQFARAPAGLGMAPPANPLTSRGGVGVGGNFSVVNYFENLTIWTGKEITNSSSTTKTFIRFPNKATPSVSPHDENYRNAYILADVMGGTVTKDAATEEYIYSGFKQPSSSSYLYASTDSTIKVGGDVLDDDILLINFPNWTNFFEYFFCDETIGETWQTFKARLGDINRTGDNVMTPAEALNSLDKMSGQIVWVEGNFAPKFARVGSISQPVILIVEGDMDVSQLSNFYGIIFVSGNISGSGGPFIYGAMIVYQDNPKITGTINIIYDRLIVNTAIKSSGAGGSMVAGTWRDWAGN